MQELSLKDRRFLKNLKRGILYILLLFFLHALDIRQYEVYPLTRFPMYGGGIPPLPGEFVDHQLRITDQTGAVHLLYPGDLYSSIEHPGTLGTAVMTKAVNDDDYQSELIRRVLSQLPDVNIAQIEVWEQIWRLDYDNFPNYDRANPDQEILLGTILMDVN